MKARFTEKGKTDSRRSENGFMLLEVLVSILLFALGIVALVGLQGRSLMTTDDVQYRAEAIHLANAYVGKMWASGLTGAQLVTRFGPGGAEFTNFQNQVMGNAVFPGIPGGQAPGIVFNNPNLVVIDAVTGLPVAIPSVDVNITISWRDRENAGVTHSYVQTSSIGY